MAVLRLLSGWKIESVIEEYCSYADDKVRDCDIKYIRNFDISTMATLSNALHDSGVRAVDRRLFPSGPNPAKMRKFQFLVALILLLWTITLFRFEYH
jgi:tyrosine-protein phosphatase SIW14